MARRLGMLTTGRQDWGILRSTAQWLARRPDVELLLFVGGMACEERFGRIEQMVEGEGFTIAERMPWLEGNPEATVEASRALAMVGAALARTPVDALILLGDRYETLSAATAATLQRVPLIHLHGGEETEGALDNAIRHAITKLAHLHLASHPTYAERIVAMGEDPEAVHVVGAPGLDNLRRTDLASQAELEKHLGLHLESPVVVVTVHPTTLALDPAAEARATALAMEAVPATYVVTLPNADPGNDAVRGHLLTMRGQPRIAFAEALGERRYWGLLRLADAVLGNSSSGLIEAPALDVPVINIGDRQKGRIRGEAVIDTSCDPTEVTSALRLALSSDFRNRIKGKRPPFGDGHAAEKIGAIIMDWSPPVPPVKRFLVGR